MKINQKFSINKLARYKQWLVGGAIIVFLLSIILLTRLMAARAHHQDQPEKAPHFVDIVTQDFNNEIANSALEVQQREVNQLQHNLTDITKKIDVIEKNEQNYENNQNDKIKSIETQIIAIKGKELNFQKLTDDIYNIKNIFLNYQNSKSDYENSNLNSSISLIQFNYKSSSHIKKEINKNVDNYVPAGTFVEAVLLGGADANASVNGQANTTPLLLRLTDNGTLPNGGKSHLKNCFVLASVYGDISSERGEIRLVNLSCYHKDKEILDIAVEGTVFDQSGKEGIRGNPVMRNSQVLRSAGIAGFLEGLSNSAKNQQTTQSISPLGTSSSVDGANAMAYSLWGGVGSAGELLAKHYIKLADQYHPIIQISAGNLVTVVFQKGFYLIPTDSSNNNTDNKNSLDNQELQKLLKSMNNYRHQE